MGNVRATITDRKFLTLTGTDPKYKAELVTATDYYAYGSPMKGRTYTAQTGSYRFGYNGKENDNEVKGEGNSLDFGARIYDSRLGRWLSVDPITEDYPELTPYQFASNTPIQAIDLDGLEMQKKTTYNSNTGVTHIQITISVKVINLSSNTSKKDALKLASQVAKQTEKSMSMYDSKRKIRYKTKVKMTYLDNFTTLDGFKEKSNYYYLLLVDQITVIDKQGNKSYAAGHCAENGNTEKNVFELVTPGNNPTKGAEMDYAADVTEENAIRNGAHELAHGAGAIHSRDLSNPTAPVLEDDNLMQTDKDGTKLNEDQMYEFQKNMPEEKNEK